MRAAPVAPDSRAGRWADRAAQRHPDWPAIRVVPDRLPNPRLRPVDPPATRAAVHQRVTASPSAAHRAAAVHRSGIAHRATVATRPAAASVPAGPIAARTAADRGAGRSVVRVEAVATRAGLTVAAIRAAGTRSSATSPVVARRAPARLASDRLAPDRAAEIRPPVGQAGRKAAPATRRVPDPMVAVPAMDAGRPTRQNPPTVAGQVTTGPVRTSRSAKARPTRQRHAGDRPTRRSR